MITFGEILEWSVLRWHLYLKANGPILFLCINFQTSKCDEVLQEVRRGDVVTTQKWWRPWHHFAVVVSLNISLEVTVMECQA